MCVREGDGGEVICLKKVVLVFGTGNFPETLRASLITANRRQKGLCQHYIAGGKKSENHSIAMGERET